jgi:hypothetical protein
VIICEFAKFNRISLLHIYEIKKNIKDDY